MRILANVCYDGTNYQGWQKQSNAPSIQEEIEKVLSQILNCKITIYGSGRTDAGVHAFGQTFHFDIDKEDLGLNRLKYSVNRLLPEDIKINSFQVVNDDFHARYSAKYKVYRYVIRFGERNPFLRNYEYNLANAFNFELFLDAIKIFEGTHNFKNFNSKPEDEKNFVRTIEAIDVLYNEKEGNITIEFVGDGFMRYMIRDMVGTAIAVAIGKEDIDFIIANLKDDSERNIVSYKAPASGLFLKEVRY